MIGSLPHRVTVYEVGPRDGLQNVPVSVPTPIKIELIERLIASGLPAVELTSVVRPDLLPALADAEELMSHFRATFSTHRLPVLVPNMKGLERALTAGVTEIAVFASATETFAQRNLNRSIADSLEIFTEVITTAKSEGVRVRGYISMCWGDPWEGEVEPFQVMPVADTLVAAGVDEISLGDTIGIATPRRVERLLAALFDHGITVDRLAVHFHDTYGQALSNTLTALTSGITTIDSSVSGLGGCPFAKSATGNLATEDLLWQLHGLGIETGVDLDKVVEASIWFEKQTGITSQSRATIALRKADQ